MIKHRRRSTDRGWHQLIRENAYRDVWLLIITTVVVIAVGLSLGTANRTSGNERRLSRAMCDIHRVLAAPSVPGQAAPSRRTRLLVQVLDGDLIGYCSKVRRATRAP